MGLEGSLGVSYVAKMGCADEPPVCIRRVSGEYPGRLPTCPRRWAERAAAGEGPTARLFGAPTWVGGVNQDSGK